MALQLFKIADATVQSPQGSIEFDNIPQGYTDLKLVISARSSRASFTYDGFTLTFNGSSSGYSGRWIRGNGSSASSGTSPYTAYIDDILGVVGASATSNTFSNMEIYIPNYTSSNYKSVSVDGVTENNAAGALMMMTAGLWSNSAAITSITLTPASGNIATNSTFTLYGVL